MGVQTISVGQSNHMFDDHANVSVDVQGSWEANRDVYKRQLQRSLTIDDCKGGKGCAFYKKSVENVCGIRFCGLSVSHSGCFSF